MALDAVSDECVRCGELGEDRRTLWMAALWDMSTLGPPFETKTLFHADLERVTDVAKMPTEINAGGQRITIAPAVLRYEGDIEPHQFFTLRVCKDCRSDWLRAIEEWFKGAKTPEGEGDIPIRELGAMKMITREEWDRRRREREQLDLPPGS